MHCSRCHTCYRNDLFDFFVFSECSEWLRQIDAHILKGAAGIRTLSRQGGELGYNNLRIASIPLKRCFLCTNGGHSSFGFSHTGNFRDDWSKEVLHDE
ncbi:unnamed protein product [Cylicocyclus nassatus]|uniref:Uncharacterized protein n=1 Tax=Cylicocyclus nassatus TaxID=53992 RepID=A0AA36MD78_CYLNA|nr:unnamed protein product [Cylicocyclus nassatus]